LSSADLAISIRGLSKTYTIAHNAQRRPTFRDVVMDRLRHPFRRAERETFWALKEVSFDVQRGEVLGVIGRNGAGKSTLLKILSRITEPTAGQVEIYGRVGSLLEVGTGFHPELTGRENIYLNGAILGMTRGEIRRRFDEIVAFADVEKFLDTPVKRYSSGMYVRLAFAVSAHLDCEILLVDEVLAVGDTQFQDKCLGKMRDASHDGKTVLVVSHNMSTIHALCQRAALLHRGELRCLSSTDNCVREYIAPAGDDRLPITAHGRRRCDFIDVRSIRVNDGNASQVHLVGQQNTLTLTACCTLRRSARVNLEARLFDGLGNLLGTFSPGHLAGETRSSPEGALDLRATMILPKLNRGQYTVTLWLTDPNICCYWEFPHAVQISASGWPLPTGQVLDNDAISGPLLLDGTIEYR
jgi:lipopolysaccharide transport system ATP-binding protein